MSKQVIGENAEAAPLLRKIREDAKRIGAEIESRPARSTPPPRIVVRDGMTIRSN